ncbi:MAG: cytochrome-c peroxidase [Candidatus Aquicultorales bacterium]
MDRSVMKKPRFVAMLLVLTLTASFAPNLALAGPEPPPLNTLTVPEPPNINDYIQDKNAAIRLGKALFWDMQVGGDGIQSCASCHFTAGADTRAKNQINPKAGGVFTAGYGPNATLVPGDFPFHQLANVDDRDSAVLFDTDDVASSQGVFNTSFISIKPRGVRDNQSYVPDPVFNVAGKDVRRVEPRNAPTTISAVFNFANFWDGRANWVFNGVNPFGASDENARVYQNIGGTLTPVTARITAGSLASQAVGPPLSDFEMSAAGRSFPLLGNKMLQMVPLGQQLVHPQDSVLGNMAYAKLVGGNLTGRPGLKTSYANMIKSAFKAEWWNSASIVTLGEPIIHEPTLQDPRKFVLGHKSIKVSKRPAGALAANQFTQMEANFSLFFGLAVQLYEATLVPSDTKFDRYRAGIGTLTPDEEAGKSIFFGAGKCDNCHGGAEFTNASVANTLGGAVPPALPDNAIEQMTMGDGNDAIYDNGFYNIGVRPTGDDIGRGGTDPFGRPLSFSRLAKLKALGQLPASVAAWTPDLPVGVPPSFRDAVDGAFKTPTVRNTQLTGPYFHNGGQATLLDVVDFYARGGDFHDLNITNLDPDIDDIGTLIGDDAKKRQLVDFLLTLTDDRLKTEQAPFDHPQLFVPNGSKGSDVAVTGDPTKLGWQYFNQTDLFMQIPAVGAGGGAPLQTFLNLDPKTRTTHD